MGGKKNRHKAEHKSDRKATARKLKKSQVAGGGWNNDPGGQRQSMIAKLWSSFMSDQKLRW